MGSEGVKGEDSGWQVEVAWEIVVYFQTVEFSNFDGLVKSQKTRFRLS
jgi:hypothetical protein